MKIENAQDVPRQSPGPGGVARREPEITARALLWPGQAQQTDRQQIDIVFESLDILDSTTVIMSVWNRNKLGDLEDIMKRHHKCRAFAATMLNYHKWDKLT